VNYGFSVHSPMETCDVTMNAANRKCMRFQTKANYVTFWKDTAMLW
jgi:hypothetical protein